MSWAREGSVLVSHPVHQHAYETVIAAQQAGALRRFVTGIYFTGRGLTSRRFLERLPCALEQKVTRELMRRWHPDLDTGYVHTIARYHILATAVRRMSDQAKFSRSLSLDIWAHRRFDEAVARLLPRLRGVEIVHAFEGSGLATLRSARRLGITTVLDATSTYETYLSAVGEIASPRDLLRATTERELADWIFAPSDYSIESLVENGVAREKILKIPYGVDSVRFAPRSGPRENDVFRVLYVGSIGLRKGVRHLLEAWQTLELAKAELVLIGQPDDAGGEILQHFEGVYRWPGQVPKYAVDNWFRQSDVFVLPSLADSWGLAVTEAMASGLPVITTSTTGAPVRDGLDGFVVPPSDVSALRDALQFLYEHPEARQRMGASGREHVTTAYTWAHYRSRIVSAYRSILSQSHACSDELIAVEC